MSCTDSGNGRPGGRLGGAVLPDGNAATPGRRHGHAWGCPFCSLVVDEAEDHAVLARRLYETHLDVHMARSDPLRAGESTIRYLHRAPDSAA